jgi:SRSO17 transposase
MPLTGCGPRIDRRTTLGDRDETKSTKNEVGPDCYEIRPWHGWHLHLSLVMVFV